MEDVSLKREAKIHHLHFHLFSKHVTRLAFTLFTSRAGTASLLFRAVSTDEDTTTDSVRSVRARCYELALWGRGRQRVSLADVVHFRSPADFRMSCAAGFNSEAAQTGVLAYLQDQLIANGYLSRPLDTASWSERETQQLEKCLNAMLAKAAVSNRRRGRYRHWG